MSARSCLKGLLLVCLFLPIAGCSSSEVDSITVSPTSQAMVVGQSVQITAVGTYGHGPNHPAAQHDVTGVAKWTSSAPSVATVSSTGLVSAVGDGTATITASMNGFTGVVSGSATITVVSPSGTGGSVSGLLSLQIIPSSVTVGNLQDTGQFLAIGTFTTAPTVRDLTNSVNWISSFPNIFPISTNGTGVAASGTTAGIVTAYGWGTADIIAEAVDPKTGSIQTAQATFNCPLQQPYTNTDGTVTSGTCYPGSQAPSLFATLTIYSAGLNSTGWLITAPSATGTPNVIHCGPGSTAAGLGAPVCTATYPIGATITVTAPAESGVNFGGWTYNCKQASPVSATGPNTCTVNLTTNDTVGAIFN
ncbi:MAG TPA: Ig-like domain-containing protein [Terracidiphilus sp.]